MDVSKANYLAGVLADMKVAQLELKLVEKTVALTDRRRVAKLAMISVAKSVYDLVDMTVWLMDYKLVA
jgi:hypothetical protein